MQICIVAEHASTHFGGEAFFALRYFMQKLIDHPDLAKALGAAGRERAVRDFDWQRRIDPMVGIYDVRVRRPVLVRS